MAQLPQVPQSQPIPPNAATDWLQRLEGVWQDPSYGDEDEKLNTLEDAYIDLREPDGAAGARALHLTLEARPRTAALEEEAGNFEDALTRYQLQGNQAGIIRCLNGMGLHSMAQVAAVSANNAGEELLEAQAECLWQMGQFKAFQEPNSIQTTFHRGIGRVLHLVSERDEASAQVQLSATLLNLHTQVQACSAKLQIVKEMKNYLESGLLCPIGEMNEEPQLTLRRCLSKFTGEQMGDLYLQSARVARKNQHLNRAERFLLLAGQHKPRRHFIEYAKLECAKGAVGNALNTLKKALEKIKLDGQVHAAQDDQRQLFAEGKLLLASINDKWGMLDDKSNGQHYQAALKAYPNSGYTHRRLALYFDKLSNEKGEEFRLYPAYAVASYISSLRFGGPKPSGSLSRLLQIWMEVSWRLSENPNSQQLKDNVLQMNKHINAMINMLATEVMLTGLSTVVAHLVHPLQEVREVLGAYIARLCIKHPQLLMWQLAASIRSSDHVRASRASAIARAKIPAVVLSTFMSIFNGFSELCQNDVPQFCRLLAVAKLTDLKADKLVRVIGTNPTIILPVNSCTFPLSPLRDMPTMVSLHTEVRLLDSYKGPRKISLLGSDGKTYPILCKNKDDLRKDAAVMEFCSVVDKYLKDTPVTSCRSLNIQTYSVIPLDESSGLIEWVQNFEPLLKVVQDSYREQGLSIYPPKVEKYSTVTTDSDAWKMEVFENLLALFPPVLQNWFTKQFNNSRSWFEARKNFARTTAVMSAVGVALGLGDRHLNNILISSINGGILHVDFDCILDKGLTLDTPEEVPFRLTQNIVTAMGPTGYEGFFRMAFEPTLRVLREEKQTLLSVLGQLSYQQQSPQEQAAITEKINEVERRLSGCHKPGSTLSVEGQAAALIQRATSKQRLSLMYVGWRSYL